MILGIYLTLAQSEQSGVAMLSEDEKSTCEAS